MTVCTIRQALPSDLDGLYRIAAEQGAVHEAQYFERCLKEQQDGKRAIFVAEEPGRLTGYVFLVWQPLYPPYRRLDIPEIQDLNVMSAARRQGIGARLVDSCEALARQNKKMEIGIGVGLSSSYGAAQRLYVRKGYLPDGAGICYDDSPLRVGDLRPVDDLLTLKFVKNL